MNDIDHSITNAYIYPFIRMQEPFSLDKITQLDLYLLNQIPLLIHSQGSFSFFGLITFWEILNCRSEAMLEGKAVNAS